ncbi:MAG: efflux RND transporter periplasmic adaptor subunit [Terriglobales bacterium]
MEQQSSRKQPWYRLRSRQARYGVLALLVAIAAVTLGLRRSSPAQYFSAAVTRGNLTATVQASGTVQAVTTVNVGAQISGLVQKLLVDFNSPVKKGQLIAQIDPTVYQNNVLSAKANLDQAEANVRSLQANVGVAEQTLVGAKASIQQAQATWEDAKLVMDQTVPLYQQGIFSKQQRDQAVTTEAADRAAVQVTAAAAAQDQAKLVAAQAQLVQAKAQAEMQVAALKVAETNLGYCNIYSPIDGVVVDRAVDVGQTVAASFQTPTLFTIAQDLSKMQVDVQTDESDVGRIHVGDPATFTLDAFPNEVFRGAVSQVRMNATTVQNVVEYDVMVNFDNPGGQVFPGMTAYVNIPVATVHNELLVPAAALRFKPELPPAQLQALLERYGMAPRRRQTAAAAPGAAGGAAAAAQDPVRRADTAMLWKLGPGNQLVPVRVQTGITNFTDTAVTVLRGSLAAGDKLVTGMVVKSKGLSPMTGGRFR